MGKRLVLSGADFSDAVSLNVKRFNWNGIFVTNDEHRISNIWKCDSARLQSLIVSLETLLDGTKADYVQTNAAFVGDQYLVDISGRFECPEITIPSQPITNGDGSYTFMFLSEESLALVKRFYEGDPDVSSLTDITIKYKNDIVKHPSFNVVGGGHKNSVETESMRIGFADKCWVIYTSHQFKFSNGMTYFV